MDIKAGEGWMIWKICVLFWERKVRIITLLKDIFFVEFLWKNTGYTEQLTDLHVVSFQGFVVGWCSSWSLQQVELDLFWSFGAACYLHIQGHHHHHHKHQGLDPLICSVSKVTTALSNISSVFQLFSFLVVCSSMISKGFGFVAFFAIVETSSVLY